MAVEGRVNKNERKAHKKRGVSHRQPAVGRT